MDIVILIDCWEGSQNTEDLRSVMCSNIINNIQVIEPELVIFATYGKTALHPILKNHTFQNQVNATSIEEFENLLEQLLHNYKPTTINCWFFGLHWNSCIKDRPLGWYNVHQFLLQKKLDVVLLAREDCTLKIPVEISEYLEVWADFEYDSMTMLNPISNGNWIIIPKNTRSTRLNNNL
jgi:hypothetical protein